MSFIARDGGVTVTLDDGLEKLVKATIDAALPGVREKMLAESVTLIDDAQAEWPVGDDGPPHSRDGLALREELDLGRSSYAVRIVGNVNGDTPYTVYVRPKAWHGATTAWARLCRSPMTKLHKELVKTLGPIITAAIKRSV
jgi:hypothetical protein